MSVEAIPVTERVNEVLVPVQKVPVRVFGPTERWPRQLLFIVIALALAGAYFWTLHQYWVPAHPGVDQNGYLVGGRQFAETFSMGLKPDDPFAFVGRMWIGTPRGEFYPKYPLGYPLLIAGAFWAGGDALGPWLAYWINPVCMALAMVGTFFLCRLLAGSFAGVIGMILLASSPVTIMLNNTPSSHATTVCCVAWGIYFLLQWWKRGGRIVAMLAGFLLGYAATIRYTEGLLLLPMLLVVAFRISNFGFGISDWKKRVVTTIQNPKSQIRNSLTQQIFLLLASWAFPLLVLVSFNLYWFGALTGYDSTNESTGFSWEWFTKNWSTMLTQLNSIALYFTLPLGMLGLVKLWGKNWQLAAVLSAWVVPPTLLYISYYWAPDGNSISYMRFMLTIFPALVACGVWMVTELETDRTARWTSTFLLGVVGALGAIVSLNTALPMLENDHRTNLVLSGVTAQARSAGVDTGALVIADERLLHHLQFTVRDLRLYSPDMFNRNTVMRMVEAAESDPDGPQGLQPQRAIEMGKLIGPMNENDLIARQNQIMDAAFAAGRKVFLIGPKRTLDPFRDKFFGKKVTRRPLDKLAKLFTEFQPTYEATVVKSWDETSDLRRDRVQRWLVPGFRRNRNPDTQAIVWQVVEVKPLKPAATSAPATTRASQ